MSSSPVDGDPTFRFDGRVAVITGSGRGLGRAHAEALAARGAAVVINDGDAEPAKETAAAIIGNGGRAEVSVHDVRDPDQATAMIDVARRAFGRIDIIINNAGGGSGGSFADQPPDEFADLVQAHLFGAVHVTRAAWPHLLEQGYGRVVMTTSAVGMWGAPGSSAYAAAKAGLIGLARSLALEGADAGVLVNCIAPAAQTRMSAARFPKAGSRTWRPGLVSPAVLYLAHERCQLSGEVLSAFAGHFSRVQIAQGPGHRFDARGEVEVEDVAAALDEILSMDGARSFENGHLDALGTPLGVDLSAVVKSLHR